MLNSEVSEVSEVLDSLRMLITPILAEDKVCLVEMKHFFQGNRLFLKLLVDRPQGGITLDECVKLNDRIGELIEREDIIKQGYVLEVSSPGLDRPLLTREDFLRCLNRKVRIFFSQRQDQRHETSGMIKSVSETGLDLDSEGEIQYITFDEIRKGKQILEEK